jgi:hypothetical protein
VAATTRPPAIGRRRFANRAKAKPRLVVAALLGLAAAGMVGMIVATALSQETYVAGDASGLANAGQAALGTTPGPTQKAAARSLAMNSLKRAPLNPAALRVLAETSDDRSRSIALFRAAQRWSRRDAITDAYLLDDALRRGDAVDAVRQADVVLRLLPQTASDAFPVLRDVAERSSVTRGVVASALVARPAWRTAFLADMAQKTADPAILFDMLSRLADARSGPDAPEIEALLSRMVADKRYLDAFISWRQFLPSNSPLLMGNIRDPTFSGMGGAPPFAWALQSGPSVAAEIQQGPAGSASRSRALRVTYDGVSATEPARQLLVLAPGAYRLSVQAYVASPLPASRLVWTIKCAGAASALAATHDGPLDPGWNTLTADFTTPASDCEGQWLTLVAVPGDNPADIDVWYGALQIRRMAGAVVGIPAYEKNTSDG